MMERNRIARLLCLALCWLVLAGAAPARAEEPLALASQAAVLLDAGQRELTEEDVQFLHNNGIKVGVWERDDVRSVF